MRKFLVFLFVALICTANVNAQIHNEVVTLELPSTVSVPAGDVTMVVFVSGGNADFMDPVSPPNGDLFVVGGNASGAAGFIASAGCGIPTLTAPAALGADTANFLIAGGDAAGNPLISNHTDLTTVNAGGLSCRVDAPNGEPASTADNAWAQTISVASATDIDSIIFAVNAAVEGNNPLGVDSDGDGIGDAASIIDGIIPVEVFFFFGTVPTFDMDGPIENPDAAFVLDLVVDPTPVMIPTSFFRFRGLPVGSVSYTHLTLPTIYSV